MSGVTRFLEAGGPVYVLVGPHPNSVGGREHPFSFFRTPQTEADARKWMKKFSWTPQAALLRLCRARHLVRVNTEFPLAALSSLKGVRVVALSEAAPDESTLSGQVAVRRSSAAPQPAAYITSELATALWNASGALDIPSATAELADPEGLGADRIARRVLTGILHLLKHGLAQLEWADGNAPINERGARRP